MPMAPLETLWWQEPLGPQAFPPGEDHRFEVQGKASDAWCLCAGQPLSVRQAKPQPEWRPLRDRPPGLRLAPHNVLDKGAPSEIRSTRLNFIPLPIFEGMKKKSLNNNNSMVAALCPGKNLLQGWTSGCVALFMNVTWRVTF